MAKPKPPAREFITPPELAREYRVCVDTVYTWIRNGELRALNLAEHPNGRPRYKIDRADIKAFEERRSSTATITPAVKQTRRRVLKSVRTYI
jgi:excisionase family DNA binding protein